MHLRLCLDAIVRVSDMAEDVADQLDRIWLEFFYFLNIEYYDINIVTNWSF